MTGATANRRQLLKSVAAGAAAAAFPRPSLAQGAAARVVVIGGGFGGASCARALRQADPSIKVTLVTGNDSYFAPPHSNAAIAGLTDLKQQTFGYGRIVADGIDVAIGAAIAIDPVGKTVTFRRSGIPETNPYQRLVISPGIELQRNFIPGYDARAAARMPAAYNNGAEATQLRGELEAMEDGGTVVITAPVNPARCPPAPYERASLIAHYLKTKKPRSKVIVLDAKDGFTMQRLFQAAWEELYPGMIEWVGLSSGGLVTAVHAASRTLVTDFDKYEAAVASIIPPQKAGQAAELAGVADRTGWCPVDPVTFVSRLQPEIHVIGDAAIAGAMPRSASAAQSQGRICAEAIAALLAGSKPKEPTLTSSCFSLLGPDYAISQRGTYRPVDGQYAEAGGGATVSPLKAPRSTRQNEAKEADAWYRAITGEVFG